MSDRIQRFDLEDKVFQSTSIEGDREQIKIFRTDNETDFIRNAIETAIAEYEAQSKVSVKVAPLDGGYTSVEATFTDMEQDDWFGIGSDFDVAFTGKGWYVCRREDGNKDGTIRLWEVKHDHGPWF